MAHEYRTDYLSQRIAVRLVSVKSRCSRETRRNRLRQAERDRGKRPGLTTNARAVELRA
jgi:transposase